MPTSLCVRQLWRGEGNFRCEQYCSCDWESKGVEDIDEGEHPCLYACFWLKSMFYYLHGSRMSWKCTRTYPGH